MAKRIGIVAAIIATATAGLILTRLVPPVRAAGDYAALVALSQEFQPIRRAKIVRGLPDYSPEALAEQRDTLKRLRARLDAIDPHAWPVSQQVDYLLVRAAMNALDFDHRVMRPWSRDPGLYLDTVRRIPFTEVPIPVDRVATFRETLGSVPALLEQARRNLTEPAGELTRMAIAHLERSDGVNEDEPRRITNYPEGTIGWHRDFVARLEKLQPELAPEARRSLSAVTAYRDWLRENETRATGPAAIGLDNYNWYLTHVRLMPYTASDLRLIANVELVRARTFLKIEEHRNRKVPPVPVVASAEEHERRIREAETLIRSFTKQEELMTMPDDLPPFPTDAFWRVRPDGHRHFWEQLTYRDPLNNHIHASIPGHQFDDLIQRKNPNPIRRAFQDGPRAEGWGFYLEEMYLQAGLLDQRPHGRELFYIAQLARAARIPAELKMQTGEYSLQQAIDYMIREVPFMEPLLGRYDLEIYLRRPAYGMNYIIGKLQVEQLLSDRAQQLGDKFNLTRFHDEFLGAGPIPIALIRWEITGLDDKIKQLW